MIKKRQKGFTLIEMVTVLAIFGMISSVVLFNYGKFRSDTVLVNMAYEVALSIREAQIYGVGSRSAKSGATTDFSTPYGIFLENGLTQYVLFGDIDTSGPGGKSDQKFTGPCDQVNNDKCVTTYTMQRGIKISSLKIKTGSNTCSLDLNDLSIVFERPNPEPLANADRNYYSSVIELSSSEDIKRYVEVYSNGQIAVLNDNPCP